MEAQKVSGDNLDSQSFCQWVVQQLDDKKAEDICVLDLRPQKIFTDFMIIASGSSYRQLAATAAFLYQHGKQFRKGIHVEDGPEWILIDFGDVILHLFKPETREIYALEKMWMVE